VPIVYKAQRALLDSLIESTFWSFITITPLMMFISRSFWAGLVAMLPNVLPVLVVFGGMGWLKIDVDVGSMMTASIALGVAVDDTIHYLNWYREALDRLKDRKQAILAAYKHCATPTFQAAIISGLGLSVFALSTFTPTQRFGYLMLVILWAGVVAELIFFPALLAGPLGVVFKPRKQKDNGHQPAEPAAALQPTTFAAVSEPEAEADANDRAVPAPAGKAALLQHLRQDNSHSRKR
jgi:predicted RND superfamily exporter protein